jgi:hypothetical protein
MKKIKWILLIIGIIIIASANAQSRDGKSSSWKATYGSAAHPHMPKVKKQKADWARHNKPAKGTHAVARAARKRFARA